MRASARVVSHPYGPEGRCPGGDECEHEDRVGVGLGSGVANHIDHDGSFEERVLETVRNLFAAHERVRDGHFFEITIH
jgi:hypothetical protein